MRARLAFAISMVIEFDCFLIDEIVAVGDARFHEKCNYELFERRGDRAMIIVSHDRGLYPGALHAGGGSYPVASSTIRSRSTRLSTSTTSRRRSRHEAGTAT